MSMIGLVHDLDVDRHDSKREHVALKLVLDDLRQYLWRRVFRMVRHHNADDKLVFRKTRNGHRVVPFAGSGRSPAAGCLPTRKGDAVVPALMPSSEMRLL